MPDIKILTDWLSCTDPEFCRLAIVVDDLNLTAHKGEEPESILVSAHPFANWLLTSFWRILYEPGPSAPDKLNHSWRMAHEMQAAGGNFFWPNIMFLSYGGKVEIRGSTAFYGQERIYSERYTESGKVFVQASQFKDEVFSFLRDASEKIDSLKKFFETLSGDFDNEETRQYRELEAMLGYDPGEAPEQLMEFLNSSFQTAGQETITELACGLNPVNFEFSPNQLKLAQEGLEPAGKAPKGSIKVALDKFSESDFPWIYGRKCAHRLREKCGVSQGDSISTDTLLDWVGLTSSQFAEIPQTGAISTCKMEQKEVAFRFQTVFSPSARRFQLARILGGYLASPDSNKYLVVSQASTWQQQMQRNFAAELLAPVNSVKAILDEDGWTADNFMAVSKKYQASPWTVANNLINNQMASRGNVERILAEI